MKMKNMILLLLCLALLLAGCSAGPAGDHYQSPNMGGELSGSSGSSDSSPGVLSDRKLIRRITTDAETEDLDALLNSLTARIATLEGYVESRNVYNGSAYSGSRYRSAQLVIRIPAQHLDSFLHQVGESSNIVSTTETSDDVTLQYVDMESRLKVLRTEQDRLLEFLANAASVSEMLEVEARLTTVQSEIESLTAQLKTYDNLVDYGTVTLNITEVEVYSPTGEPTLWEKIRSTFSESLSGLRDLGQGLLIFLLGNSPYLLLLALIGCVVWLLVRKRIHKPTPPKEEKSE